MQLLLLSLVLLRPLESPIIPTHSAETSPRIPGRTWRSADIMVLTKMKLWTVSTPDSHRKEEPHLAIRLDKSSWWKMTPNSPPELPLRPLISSNQPMSQPSSQRASSQHGTTLTRTTRDGSDTKRPTLSRDSSTVHWTSSRMPQAPSWTFPPEVPLTHSHTHRDLSKLQSDKSE